MSESIEPSDWDENFFKRFKTLLPIRDIRKFLQATGRDTQVWGITTAGPETQFHRVCPPLGEVVYVGIVSGGTMSDSGTLEIYELRMLGTTPIGEETL